MTAEVECEDDAGSRRNALKKAAVGAAPRYRRLLIKLSGEALAGGPGESPGQGAGHGIGKGGLTAAARRIRALHEYGVQTALVIGGGNFLRGAALADSGVHRVTADQMGMLATLLNALAMCDALERLGVEARVLSALCVNPVCESYSRRRALQLLDRGCLVVCAAGTGNPYFTTDTAASLRAVELGAELLIKATKVDGVYAADPQRDPKARRFRRLDYDEALRRRLGFMDAAALLLCREHRLAVRVLDMNQPDALLRVARGEDEGTLIDAGA